MCLFHLIGFSELIQLLHIFLLKRQYLAAPVHRQMHHCHGSKCIAMCVTGIYALFPRKKHTSSHMGPIALNINTALGLS